MEILLQEKSSCGKKRLFCHNIKKKFLEPENISVGVNAKTHR